MNQVTYEKVGFLSDIPIMYKSGDVNGEFIPNHWHEHLEIIYIVQGHMEVRLPNSVTQLYDQDFMIINSGEIHSTSCPIPSKMYLFQIPLQFLEQHISDYHTIRFENPSLPGHGASAGVRGDTLADEIRNDLYTMGTVYEQHSRGYALAFQSSLFHLLYLLDKHTSVKVSPVERTKSDKNREQLSKVTSYVANHYKENISLQTAASLINLQPEYFCRFFKRFMGMTFLDYVHEVRFSYVYEDILKTDYSIHDILEKHGFTNYKLFMRLFREKYNCTPTMKRKSILP